MDTSESTSPSGVEVAPTSPPLTTTHTVSPKFEHSATHMSNLVAEFHLQGDLMGESQQELINRFLVEVSEREERSSLLEDCTDALREPTQQQGCVDDGGSSQSPSSSQQLPSALSQTDESNVGEQSVFDAGASSQQHQSIASLNMVAPTNDQENDTTGVKSEENAQPLSTSDDVTIVISYRDDDMPATVCVKEDEDIQAAATTARDVEMPVSSDQRDLISTPTVSGEDIVIPDVIPVPDVHAVPATTPMDDVPQSNTPTASENHTNTTLEVASSKELETVVTEEVVDVVSFSQLPTDHSQNASPYVPPRELARSDAVHPQDTLPSLPILIPTIQVDGACEDESEGEEQVPNTAREDVTTTRIAAVDKGEIPDTLPALSSELVSSAYNTKPDENTRPSQVVITSEMEEGEEEEHVRVPADTFTIPAIVVDTEAETTDVTVLDQQVPPDGAPAAATETTTTLPPLPPALVHVEEGAAVVVESPPGDFDDDADFYVERDDEDGGAVAATPLDTAVLTTTSQTDIIHNGGAGLEEIASPRGGGGVDVHSADTDDSDELMLATEASEVEGLAGSPVIDLAEGGIPPLPATSSAFDVYESPGGRFQRQDAAVKRATFGDSASDVEQASPNTRGPSATRQVDYEDSERGTSQVPADADDDLLVDSNIIDGDDEVAESPIAPHAAPSDEEVPTTDTPTCVSEVEQVVCVRVNEESYVPQAMPSSNNVDNDIGTADSTRDSASASPEAIPLAPPESDTSTRGVSETAIEDHSHNPQSVTEDTTQCNDHQQLHPSTQAVDGGDVTPNGELNLTSTLRHTRSRSSSTMSGDGCSPSPHRKAGTEQVSEASTPTEQQPPASLLPPPPPQAVPTIPAAASEWDNKYFHISPINDMPTNHQRDVGMDAAGKIASERPSSSTVRVTRAEPFVGMRSQRLSSPIRRSSSAVDTGVGAPHHATATFTPNPQQSGSPPSVHTAAPFQPWVPPKIVVRPNPSTSTPSGAVAASSPDRASLVRSPERGSRSSPEQHTAPPNAPLTHSNTRPTRQRTVSPPGQNGGAAASSHPPQRHTSAPRTRTPTSRPITPQRKLDNVAAAISTGEMPPELCLRTRPTRGGVGVYPSALQPQELGKILGFMLERKGRDPAAIANYANQLRHNKSTSVAPPPSSTSMVLSRTSSGTVSGGRTFVSIHSHTAFQFTPQNSYTQQHHDDLLTPTSSNTPATSGIHGGSRSGVQRSTGAAMGRKVPAHISSGGVGRTPSETVDRSVLAALVAKQLQRRF